MRDGDELYLDVKQNPRGAEIKSESDFMCSNLESSGSYKCIKCCKVSLLGKTNNSFDVSETSPKDCLLEIRLQEVSF